MYRGGSSRSGSLLSSNSCFLLLGSSDPCSPDQQLQLGPEQDSLPLPPVPSGVHLQGQSRGASQVQETRQSCGKCLSWRRKLFATTSMYFRICFPANKQCVCESLLEPEEQSGKHLWEKLVPICNLLSSSETLLYCEKCPPRHSTEDWNLTFMFRLYNWGNYVILYAYVLYWLVVIDMYLYLWMITQRYGHHACTDIRHSWRRHKPCSNGVLQCPMQGCRSVI